MLRKSLDLLFYAVVLELTLGGGGRLTAIGPVTLRMVLFALAVAATAIYFLRFNERLPGNLAWLTAGFVLMLIIGVAPGIVNGSTPAAIWEDVKPLLYFFLLPFVFFSINNAPTLSKIFKYVSVGMAVVFIGILVAIHSGIIPFLSFYHTVLDTGEFFFRGELTFFYKGFLYLCIGLIFLLEDKGRKWQIFVVVTAILLTVTRGFWLSLLLTYGAYYAVFSTKKIRAAILIVTASVLLIFGQDLIVTVSKTVDQEVHSRGNDAARPYLFGDRTHSDNERMRQIFQVRERVTPTSVIIGHGFGQGIPSRPIHMEISYLEIFHKQGIIGLAVWAAIFGYGVRQFLRLRSDPYSVPFFLSFVFVFIQSLSNQFINNPIGLFMIIITLSYFEKKIPRADVAGESSRSL